MYVPTRSVVYVRIPINVYVCLVVLAPLQIVGEKLVLAGNVDPMVLYCGEEVIRKSVHDCIGQAKGRHVLNLGHGATDPIHPHWS